jgi:acyl carrier protein
MTMPREEIEGGIKLVAATHLDAVSGVDPDARLIEDLALDSLQLLTLSFEIENYFEIILEPEDQVAIVTVRDLADTIARLLAMDVASPTTR